jgi:serine protease
VNPAVRKVALTFLSVVLLSLVSSRSSHAGLPTFASDELLVKFKPGVSAEEAGRAIRGRGAALKRVLTADGLVQMKVPPGAKLEDEMARLGALPGVEYATLNAYGSAFSVPNDTLFQVFDVTWNLRDVGAVNAWDVVTGHPKVVLAIIDTGVAYEDRAIPDYEIAHLWPGSTMYHRSPELSGPFLPGHDFVNDDDHADDDNGHGTIVATVAAGQANNHIGAAGIAFGVTILPIKVLSYNETGDVATIVQGIRYAADRGADIANLSLGFQPLSRWLEAGFTADEVRTMFRPLREAVQYAQSRGVILVAATGNFGDPELSYPAVFPGVISVGATDVLNHVTSYSNFGKGLHFVAPGGDFPDLTGDGDLNDDGVPDGIAVYTFKRWRDSEHHDNFAKPDSFGVFFDNFGTSFAAPHVSGAVALLESMGLRSQGEIEQVLRATAFNPRGTTGPDALYGAGVIQIDKAVRLAASRGPAPRLTLGGSSAASTTRILSQNPSRAGAAISFRVGRPGPVQVLLYDLNGRLVRTLESGTVPAGERIVRWDGKDDRGAAVGNGVYFFRVATPDGVEQRKVAVLH